MIIYNCESSVTSISRLGGGKARNLKVMHDHGAPVPNFVVISAETFTHFLKSHNIYSLINESNLKATSEKVQSTILAHSFSKQEINALENAIIENNLAQSELAIRSSGLDEDSNENSFAGMFESFLYQRTLGDITSSILKCWASAFSTRCLEYRKKNNLSFDQISMGVVIQRMVNSRSSGVLFTRNPIDLIDKNNIIIESVWGQCEGLVSGELDSDHFEVDRVKLTIQKDIKIKEYQFLKNCEKAGILKVSLNENQAHQQSITDSELQQLATLAIKLEEQNQMPLDIEWAIEDQEISILQMRPITTLPPLSFYNETILGKETILWDNSNIVESFSGVTTPLTFSLTKEAYAIVYRQTCRILNVPEKIIKEYDYAFENMLGFIRGRVYYNLINWYKLLFLIPGSASNQGFMETMMGVKEELSDEQQHLFNFVQTAPKYSVLKQIAVAGSLIYKFININKIINTFQNNFNEIYNEYLANDFKSKSLKQNKDLYLKWNNNVTYSWKAPIINDFFVMIFFGVLKKLTQKWIQPGQENQNLQNDLLCGQGEIESTMPTITIMQLSEKYDQVPALREYLLNHSTEDIVSDYHNSEMPAKIIGDIDSYLHKYGFRCNNEQKLEEEDLHSKPDFIFNNIKNYIKMKNYSVEQMYQRELLIKEKAIAIVKQKLSGIKRIVFFWILKHARNAVKNRENLRFLRSKSFGISRRIFNAIDEHLYKLELIENRKDSFYLSYREIFDFIDGKAESLCLKELATIRRSEFSIYQSEQDPPDRFLTCGAAGASLTNPQLLESGNLLKNKIKVSDDPNLFYGVSCCPGNIKGKVRVALSIDDARDMNGEILVTKRTDPGWVTLFPFCIGIIIERGSLLSHSAVIARELGIPTIVGVPSELLTRLRTGNEIELNATQGEVRILNHEH